VYYANPCAHRGWHVRRRYLAIAQQRFKGLVRLFVPPKGKKGGSALSADWQRQATMQQHMKSLPCWAQLKEGVDQDRGLSAQSTGSYDARESSRSGFREQVETDESALILELIHDVPTKDESIFDMHTIKCIAYLHESMNWFAETLEQVALCLEAGDHRGLSQLWEHVGPVVDEDLLAAEGHNVPDIIASTVTESQISAIRATASKYHAIAFACLATLRLELRVHCLHYLMPVFRKSSHVCSAEQIEEADAQVRPATFPEHTFICLHTPRLEHCDRV
jgi:exocyst complex component 4